MLDLECPSSHFGREKEKEKEKEKGKEKEKEGEMEVDDDARALRDVYFWRLTMLWIVAEVWAVKSVTERLRIAELILMASAEG